MSKNLQALVFSKINDNVKVKILRKAFFTWKLYEKKNTCLVVNISVYKIAIFLQKKSSRSWGGHRERVFSPWNNDVNIKKDKKTSFLPPPHKEEEEFSRHFDH